MSNPTSLATAPACGSSEPQAGSESSRIKKLEHDVEHAAHLLPAQGPIEVFVHHNTLHAFEDLPFHQAVREGHQVYGANPYLAESTYRDMLQSGRIRLNELESIVREDLGEQADRKIGGIATRLELRMAMLKFRFDTGSDAELRWLVAETDALEKFRDEVPYRIRERMIKRSQKWLDSHGSNGHSNDAAKLVSEDCGEPSHRWREKEWEEFVLRFLWRVCRQGVQQLPPPEAKRGQLLRPRDILMHATGEDIDQHVNEFLVRFVSAFLDQGYADWSMPHRDEGLYRAFLQIYRHRKSPPDAWLRGLKREVISLYQSQIGPAESILDSMEVFGVPEDRQGEFITQTLLALRGWAGMVWQMESAADWTARPAPKGSLLEYLAIRLVLEHQAILHVGAKRLQCDRSATEILEIARQKIRPRGTMSIDRRAFWLFQLAQIEGWHPEVLLDLEADDWHDLVEEFESFRSMDRRRIFHEAYEARYRIQALDAFAIHSAERRKNASATDNSAAGSGPTRPSFQIVCCIDDREESFRRHIEEIDPASETFGAAGFFAVVINYRGATDAYYKPLCPVIVTPEHFVTENVGYTFEGVNQQRATSRQQLGKFTLRVHAGSRTFLGGIFTGLFGSLATAPLVARVLFPWLTARIRSLFGQLLQPPPVTQLQLERYKEEPGDSDGNIGFTVEEMADIVQRLMQDIGVTEPHEFARLFVVCGHGAASLNNPHESAYCCGACAGKRGGPNARAFAQMANDWRVRALLEERGLKIPKDTYFIGAYHDTTNDSVVWYDLDRMPASHHDDFEHAQTVCDEARTRNAHERCRRFASAPLNISYKEARRHVETRGQDLSQVRPEYNHATDALCIVGNRDWSRGLFLDRRAFLTSYDPAKDDEESSILFRILAAAIPVCAGINLEYYFSAVDNKQYGSGSKLPHNLVSMLGVMEGANSDLRTGLYQQMIEIHEPMRLLFVIECTQEAMLGIIERHEGIRRLCQGDWIQLALIDPDTSRILRWHQGKFVPYEPSVQEIPTVNSSLEWYEKKRGHLGFATIKEPSGTECP